MLIIKNVIKIASVYTGAILGAGFASGKELTEYFICYGNKGFLGLLLAGFLFGLIGWAIMDISYNNNIKSYKEFTNIVLGKAFGNLIEWISVIFMFVLFSTMLSAGGAIAAQTGFIKSETAIIILTFVCVITFMFDMKGLIYINSIASPIMLLGGIFLGLYSFFDKTVFTSTNISLILKNNWISKSFIYVAYNIITSVSVLTSMGDLVTNKKVAKYGGLAGGATLGIMGICLGLGIIVNYNDIASLELPVLSIASKYGLTIESMYMILLILAVYTTAAINGYSAITWGSQKFKIEKKYMVLLFVCAGFIAGHLQFSKFISVIYPIFGYIGLFEIIVILFNFILSKQKQL